MFVWRFSEAPKNEVVTLLAKSDLEKENLSRQKFGFFKLHHSKIKSPPDFSPNQVTTAPCEAHHEFQLPSADSKDLHGAMNPIAVFQGGTPSQFQIPRQKKRFLGKPTGAPTSSELKLSLIKCMVCLMVS